MLKVCAVLNCNSGYPNCWMTPKGHPEIGVKWIVMIQLMTDFRWKLHIFRPIYDKIKGRKYALLAA